MVANDKKQFEIEEVVSQIFQIASFNQQQEQTERRRQEQVEKHGKSIATIDKQIK